MLASHGTRLPDVCHRAHLYTVALGAVEVRITSDAQGASKCTARLAGLPRGVTGLWWPAQAWASLLERPVPDGPSAEWFVRHVADLREAVARLGLDAAETRLARAEQARRAPR